MQMYSLHALRGDTVLIGGNAVAGSLAQHSEDDCRTSTLMEILLWGEPCKYKECVDEEKMQSKIQ